MTRQVISIIIAGTLAISIVGCGSSAKHGGYYNMSTLDSAIMQQANTVAGDPNLFTNVTCTPSGGNTAGCLTTVSGGGQIAVTATISQDGSSFILSKN